MAVEQLMSLCYDRRSRAKSDVVLATDIAPARTSNACATGPRGVSDIFSILYKVI